jgi:hypothetical protein
MDFEEMILKRRAAAVGRARPGGRPAAEPVQAAQEDSRPELAHRTG